MFPSFKTIFFWVTLKDYKYVETDYFEFFLSKMVFVLKNLEMYSALINQQPFFLKHYIFFFYYKKLKSEYKMTNNSFLNNVLKNNLSMNKWVWICGKFNYSKIQNKIKIFCVE